MAEPDDRDDTEAGAGGEPDHPPVFIDGVFDFGGASATDDRKASEPPSEMADSDRRWLWVLTAVIAVVVVISAVLIISQRQTDSQYRADCERLLEDRGFYPGQPDQATLLDACIELNEWDAESP